MFCSSGEEMESKLNGIISVFASFSLLSFTKVLFQLLFLLTYQKIYHIGYTIGVYLGVDLVVEYDFSVPRFVFCFIYSKHTQTHYTFIK